MTQEILGKAAPLPPMHRFLPMLLLLFVGSGCSALIYEIVWFQLLQLIIGSSAASLAVLLGAFMGGMCLGSLLLPRWISPRPHPLRVYGCLELGIGISGIVLLFGMPYIDQVYTTSIGHWFPGLLLRSMICAVCLLPPTLMMGATLPAIARWIETTPQGVSWLGLFYSSNIGGAVVGCLLAGFYLLRIHDMPTATYVAAALNILISLIAFVLAKAEPYTATDNVVSKEAAKRNAGHSAIYLVIAISGMCAMGAELLWTRTMSLMLGATVYAFTIILAVFLLGLGIGSSAGAFIARQSRHPQLALGACQLMQAAALAWAASVLGRSLPFWSINPSVDANPWFAFQMDLLRCMWAMLPATCLWGASIPLALAAIAAPQQEPGQLVGRLYAANTVGAIAGVLAFSLALIQWRGTQQSEQLLIGLSTGAGIWMLLPLGSLWGRVALGKNGSRSIYRVIKTVGAAACLFVGTLLAWSVPRIPDGLVAYGRSLPTYSSLPDFLYVGEGRNASIAVSKLSNSVRNFHVSGKVEASTEPQDMRLQRLLGHLPALLHPKPKSVLIVGFGAGVTAGTFVLHPDIERIVICEIEPLIPQVVSQYFRLENYDVLQDRRTEVIYDDARHYILTTKETFDIITSDPIHPWVKGAATLYTEEYFQMCRRHLNPGGIMSQWIPLYESGAEVVKSEIATFFSVFPKGTIWSNEYDGGGYDLVLLGQPDFSRIQIDEVQKRLNRADHANVEVSLSEVGFQSALGIFATYAGQGSDLKPWLKNAEINRDRNLRLQYLAGMWLNSHQSQKIYSDLLAYYRFPDELFEASEQTLQSLRALLGSQHSNQ